MKPHRDDIQTAQRLRVGVIGLVVVVLLIALAGWIIDSTTRDAATNGTTEIALNLAADNAAAAGEPLAEMGAAPGSFNEQADPKP
jgi:hypothetical protein